MIVQGHLHCMIDRDLNWMIDKALTLEPKWLWAMAVFYAC